MKRLEKRSMGFDFVDRLAIGVAAAGGLVMAACISGLPSASCTALAETCAKAIGFFGVSAFVALLGLVALEHVSTELNRGDSQESVDARV